MPSNFKKPKILPAGPTQSQMLAYAAASGQSESEELLPIHHYLWLIRRAWWKIALAVITSTVLVTVFCFVVTPIYQSTARITVDNKTPSTLLGQGGQPQDSADVEEFLNTEMDLIASDAVLRPVAEQYHLLPRDKNGRELVPDGPVTLKNLSITHPANSLLLNISYRSADAHQAANVANAVAHAYIDHVYENRVSSSTSLSGVMEKQLDDLKLNMNKSAGALAAYQRQLGVVDPAAQTSMLAARVLQLNQDYTEAQNDRIRKQAAYNAMKSGDLAALEISTQADQLGKLQQQLQDEQQKVAEMRTHYGVNNPAMRAEDNQLAEMTRQYAAMRQDIGKRISTDYAQAANHEAMLRDALAQAKAQSDHLSADSVQYQQLQRDADANKTLYNELYQKIKEASIDSSFDNSTIRIADEARPQSKPIFPKKSIFIAMGFFLSLVFSTITVLLADLLDKSVRDPEQARRQLNLEVLGVLPDVIEFKPAGRQLLLQNGTPQAAGGHGPIDWARSHGAYTEAIRTMRSLVLMERTREPLRSLLVTSAVAGEGKSTCTAHMAIAHAMQGRKTLLIDADLRRPSQHSHFALKNTQGLADVVLGGRSLAEVAQPAPGVGTLDVVTSGPISYKAAHLLGSRIPDLLEEAGKHYDLIVIDSPPMLGLAEPIQIACAADGVILITRAGETNQQVVAGALSTLQRLDVNVLGLVLNKVRREMSMTYRHYGVYGRYDEPVLNAS